MITPVSEFAKAKEIMISVKPLEDRKFLFNFIGSAGAVVAGAFAVVSAITFSAVWITAASATAAGSIGLFLLSVATKRAIAQKTRDFPADRRVEIAAETFQNTLQILRDFSYDSVDRMIRNINSVSDNFIGVRFDSLKGESPQFSIRDDNLSEERVLSLLETAYNNGIVLHLSSLETLTLSSFKDIKFNILNQSVSEKQHNEKIRVSALVSVKLVKRCFEADEINAESLNAQLEALAVKYTNPRGEGQTLMPSVFMEDKATVVLYSHFGEVGSLQEIVNAVDAKELIIKVAGHGFKATETGNWINHDIKPWKKYFNRYTHTTRYRSTDIQDCTDDKNYVRPFWQSKSIPTRNWLPSLREYAGYLNEKHTS